MRRREGTGEKRVYIETVSPYPSQMTDLRNPSSYLDYRTYSLQCPENTADGLNRLNHKDAREYHSKMVRHERGTKANTIHNISNCRLLSPPFPIIPSHPMPATYQTSPATFHPSMTPKPQQIPRVCMDVWYSKVGEKERVQEQKGR